MAIVLVGQTRRLLQQDQDDRGQTLVEYALILALVSLVLVGGLQLLSASIGDFFSDLIDTLDGLL